MTDDKRRAMQERLIEIKNDCEDFAAAVERLLNTPGSDVLLAYIGRVARQCVDYLNDFGSVFGNV